MSTEQHRRPLNVPRVAAEELTRYGTREAASSRVVGGGEPAREALQTV